MYLIGGLILLLAGAEALVRGASTLSARLGIPPLVVGLTVVAFGTSLPEMLVAVISGYSGNSDLAIATVLGSNVCNVLLVLGVAALIRPLPVNRSLIVTEIPFSLAAVLLVGFLANAALFSTDTSLTLSRIDGAIMLFFFLMFMMYVYYVSTEDPPADEIAQDGTATMVALLVGGCIALYFGGSWTVDGALGVAETAGITNAAVGLTVIAIGTSSPELLTSAVAAYRRQTDLAIGNVVGSNIFNLLWILGATAFAFELPFQVLSNIDIAMVVASTSLIIIALVVSRNLTISRTNGAIYLVLYGIYLYYATLRV